MAITLLAIITTMTTTSVTFIYALSRARLRVSDRDIVAYNIARSLDTNLVSRWQTISLSKGQINQVLFMVVLTGRWRTNEWFPSL